MVDEIISRQNSCCEGLTRRWPTYFQIDEKTKESNIHWVSNRDQGTNAAKRVSKRRKSADDPNTEDGLTWRRLYATRSKLKSSASSSHVLCGFAMMSAAELQINDPADSTVPDWIWILYLLCTVLLLSVHVFSLMISSYILPHIDATTQINTTKAVKESPHEKLRKFVEVAWTLSNICGLFLFLIELMLICVVKFWDFTMNAVICGLVIVTPVLIVYIGFAMHFYRVLLQTKFKTSLEGVENLEHIKEYLDIMK